MSEFNLDRFTEAQAAVYGQALGELRSGRKQSHWMWFVFPQHAELGRSATAKFYGLSGRQEAAAYLAHPLLGPRLAECTTAVRAQVAAGRSLEAIFGSLDAMKFKSSMQIFGIEE